MAATTNPQEMPKRQIWTALDFQRADMGLLVTEKGEGPDRPIAFIDTGTTGDEEGLRIAQKIADDPRAAGFFPCIDLRHFGHLDSREEMPGFVYGLWCLRGAALMQPSPFCKFRRDRLNRQFEAMRRGLRPRRARKVPAPRARKAARRRGPAAASAASEAA